MPLRARDQHGDRRGVPARARKPGPGRPAPPGDRAGQALAGSGQLLASGQRPELSEAVEDITGYLVWRAPGGSKRALAAARWQARLLAAGWPVPPPGQLSLASGNAQAEAPVLPASLIEEAQETLRTELGAGDPSWTAASVIALWVRAAGSMAADGGQEARRIAAFLARQVRDHDARHAEMPYPEPPPGQDPAPGVRPVHGQLRHLITAVITWCQNADSSAPLRVPPASRPRSVAVFARDLPGRRDVTDWIYRGVITDDDETFVVVGEPDGSLRLLRDAETRARGLFTWGYGGTGPHTLADVLLADVLAGHARCPACLGAAPCGAGVARLPQLRRCRPTRGNRGGRGDARPRPPLADPPGVLLGAHPAGDPQPPRGRGGLTRGRPVPLCGAATVGPHQIRMVCRLR